MFESPFKYTEVEGIGTCIAIPLSEKYVTVLNVRANGCELHLTYPAFLELILQTIKRWDELGREIDLSRFQENARRVTLIEMERHEEVTFKFAMKSVDNYNLVQIIKDEDEICVEVLAEFIICLILKTLEDHGSKLYVKTLDRTTINTLRTQLSLAQSLEVT